MFKYEAKFCLDIRPLEMCSYTPLSMFHLWRIFRGILLLILSIC